MLRKSGLGLLLAGALVGVLSACANGVSSDGGSLVPADQSTVGSAMSLGASGAGNYLAGRFAQDQHDLDKAPDYLLRALAGDPENAELLQRAYLALAVDGRLDQAAEIARRLLQFDDEASIAAILVAEQAAKAGRWSDAEQVMSSLPRRGLGSFMAPLVVAWSKVGEGKIDAALEALAPLAQNSSFAALHDFHAALINDLADRPKAAEQYYLVTLAGNGGLTLRTAEAAISFYNRTGQPEKAREILARYQADHPETGGAIDPNLKTRPVASAKEGMAEVMFGTAGSLRQSGAAELALAFARMAVDLQPDFSLAQVTVADLLQTLGQLPAADEIYRTVAADSPVFWAARLRLAANLDELGEVDESVKTLEGLATQFPDRAEALITLGDILRRHKRWAEAVTAYDRAIALFRQPEREQWVVYYARGIALERDKQWVRAESDFLKALELQPDEPHVLNYLGYSWIEQGTNLDEAKRMLEKAVEQRPTDGYIVDSLGWALFRAGDYGNAVKTLERAVELHPDDATINDHLGDALWTVGRQDEARFQWERALVFDPEPELKTEIERKLKVGLEAAAPAAAPAASAVKANNAAVQ